MGSATCVTARVFFNELQTILHNACTLLSNCKKADYKICNFKHYTNWILSKMYEKLNNTSLIRPWPTSTATITSVVLSLRYTTIILWMEVIRTL